MLRISILELPLRTHALHSEELSQVFGGCIASGEKCAANGDACQCCGNGCSAAGFCYDYQFVPHLGNEY
jgi:hypothetical protein